MEQESVVKGAGDETIKLGAVVNEEEPLVTPVPDEDDATCEICLQDLKTVVHYNGHPNNAVEESVALVADSLMLFSTGMSLPHEEDKVPINKITNYTIYDVHGHLVSLDSGLIEQDIELYASGFLKCLMDEDPSAENGIATKDIGPLTSWFITGYREGETASVSFMTMYAEYFLMKPSAEYEPMMKSTNVKVSLAKIVLEFLLTTTLARPTYKALLNRLTAADFSERILLENAQFVYDQVYTYNAAAHDPGQVRLDFMPCIRHLVKRGHVIVQRHYRGRKVAPKNVHKRAKHGPVRGAAKKRRQLLHDVTETGTSSGKAAEGM